MLTITMEGCFRENDLEKYSSLKKLDLAEKNEEAFEDIILSINHICRG